MQGHHYLINLNVVLELFVDHITQPLRHLVYHFLHLKMAHFISLLRLIRLIHLVFPLRKIRNNLSLHLLKHHSFRPLIFFCLNLISSISTMVTDLSMSLQIFSCLQMKESQIYLCAMEKHYPVKDRLKTHQGRYFEQYSSYFLSPNFHLSKLESYSISSTRQSLNFQLFIFDISHVPRILGVFCYQIGNSYCRKRDSERLQISEVQSSCL